MTEENPTSLGERNPQGGAEGDKNDFVKHSTYVQVIDEVKSVKGKLKGVQAENNEYKIKEQQAAEQKLLDEKKYLEVIENLKQENTDLQSQNSNHIQEKTDFRKMNAALGLLQSKGINLESKYLELLPIDNIEVTEDGDIDNSSVANVVENFQKEHPRLTLPATKLLPNDKPGSSNASKMSIDQWKMLPPKEKAKAYAEGRVKRPG